MAWELLAIWVIVSATVIWFIRDEKRVQAEADLERAARYYAHAPKYRHISPEPVETVTPPARRTGGLSQEQRDFIATLYAAKAPVSG